MVKRIASTLVVLVGLVVVPRSATADACYSTYWDCSVAACKNSFFYAWAALIDCELDYIECARISVIGR